MLSILSFWGVHAVRLPFHLHNFEFLIKILKGHKENLSSGIFSKGLIIFQTTTRTNLSEVLVIIISLLWVVIMSPRLQAKKITLHWLGGRLSNVIGKNIKL